MTDPLEYARLTCTYAEQRGGKNLLSEAFLREGAEEVARECGIDLGTARSFLLQAVSVYTRETVEHLLQVSEGDIEIEEA